MENFMEAKLSEVSSLVDIFHIERNISVSLIFNLEGPD